MGIVKSILVRPVKKFNIENRAHKVISSDKPFPAPQYPSALKQLEIAKQTNPDFMKEHYKRDPALHDRLKEVYVDSTEGMQQRLETSRPLPVRTISEGEDEYTWGFWEPKTVSKGRCSLRSTMKFLDAHIENPQTHTAETIAKQHDLDVNDVSNILEYYGVFKYDQPLKEKDELVLDAYSQLQLEDDQEKEKRKELEK